ncbi:MAG: thiamine biosynthesis protein ThiS [Deltaproteobacteria bacterium RIFOXYD12_FULL_57_12]|nr:MAG: thiamine biosynthesis protein ThiS [Deltaproteobacteria bacterium RIFOXYD12_FULL_57_12]
MKIICNGQTKETRDGISLHDFIRESGLNPGTVVAECDGVIIRREDYETCQLKENSMVELIRFVGGG